MPVRRASAARHSPASLTIEEVTPRHWADLARLFGPRGACAGCWCQWPRLTGAEFRASRGDGNRRRLQRLVRSGEPVGLLAYRDGEPVGWCALSPRSSFRRFERSRVLADVDAKPVWSVPCFFVAREARGARVTAALLRAAARVAAEHGAPALEGYPLDLKGKRTAAAFAWWGLRSAFEQAGFTEVARRSPTRPIMRKTLRRKAASLTARKSPPRKATSPRARHTTRRPARRG